MITYLPHRRKSFQPVTGSSYLLDTYGTGVVAAYSLRQLKTGITAVARGKRTSDSAESDFTQTEITDGTLSTFAGTSNVENANWYDQSGNGYDLDTLQTSATAFPLLAESGTPCLANTSYPTVRGTGSQGYQISDIPLTAPLTVSGVFKYTYGVYDAIWAHYNATSGTQWLTRNPLKLQYGDPALTGAIEGVFQQVAVVYGSGATLDAYLNGTLVLDDEAYTATVNTGTLWVHCRVNNQVQADICELVFWNGDKSSDLAAIQADQKSAWGIS